MTNGRKAKPRASKPGRPAPSGLGMPGLEREITAVIGHYDLEIPSHIEAYMRGMLNPEDHPARQRPNRSYPSAPQKGKEDVELQYAERYATPPIVTGKL